jgi:site-specific recombinase XerD
LEIGPDDEGGNMLADYFKRATTRQRYYSGPAGPYLDDFTAWLIARGYRWQSIKRSLLGAAALGIWAKKTDRPVKGLPSGALLDYRSYLRARRQLRAASGRYSGQWLGGRLFLEFLHEAPRHACDAGSEHSSLPALVLEFERWMRTHRGVQESTLCNYRRHLVALVSSLSERPTGFRAAKLRDFVLEYAKSSGLHPTKTRVNATRAFIRFLIATARCRPGLEAAIPTIAEWKLAVLPRYLVPEDVERVISACSGSTATHIRNKAIILLLARLGLRASEVAGLTFSAVDWQDGAICVLGKGRREARLPLPQEVGDALLDYIEKARPRVRNRHVFIRAIAPWTPITRYVVKSAAARAIRRAGIDAPSFGAHVLRHSAATRMLREGASLQTVSRVLRHQSIDMTAHYAKIDPTLLGRLTVPWPTSPPCR